MEVEFADIILKGGTTADYQAANETLDVNEIAVLDDADGIKKVILAKTVGDITTVTKLASEEFLDNRYDDIQANVDANAAAQAISSTEQILEETARLTNGTVVDMTPYHLLDSKEDEIIYASGLNNIINPENCDIFESNKNSVNGIEVYEEYENLIYPIFRGDISVVATSSTHKTDCTDIIIPAGSTAYISYYAKWVTLTTGTGDQGIELRNTIDGLIGSRLATLTNEYTKVTAEISNNKLNPAFVRIYTGTYNNTLGNEIAYKDLFVTTIPNAPYARDKHEADTVVISTAGWGSEGQLGFRLKDYTRNTGFYQEFFDSRTTAEPEARLVVRYSSTNLVQLYWQEASADVSHTISNGDLIIVSWSLTACKLYVNGILKITITIPFVKLQKEICVMKHYTDQFITNAKMSELFYSPSTTLITKPIADKDITYYPNGSYKDKFNQLRVAGDERPYEESRDNRFVTSPENVDIVYHVKGEGSNRGRAVHKNFIEDSVYPVETSDGIWCGEAYENEPYTWPLIAHSTAVFTSSLFKDGFTINVTILGTTGYVTAMIKTSPNVRYVTFRMDLRTGGLQFKKGSSGQTVPIVNTEGNKYSVELPVSEVIYIGDSSTLDCDIYDIMITTVPNAPYVKDKQPASAVKIDTSTWNKKSGSFSFEVGTALKQSYIIDSRSTEDTSLDFLIGIDTTFLIDIYIAAVKYDTYLTTNLGVKYSLVWGNGKTLFYADNVLIITIPAIPLFNFDQATIGSAYNKSLYSNSNISNLSYRNSTELAVKSVIDPRFTLLSNGSLTDDSGNLNDDVWYNRQLEKATAVETWVVGEDILFENGWENYSDISPYDKPKVFVTEKNVTIEGWFKNGINGVAFVLPEDIRPSTRVPLSGNYHNGTSYVGIGGYVSELGVVTISLPSYPQGVVQITTSFVRR